MTDSPAAPDRSLQAQPASEDIANALQIVEPWCFGPFNVMTPQQKEVTRVFFRLQALLRGALAKLDGASGPPNTQERP